MPSKLRDELKKTTPFSSLNEEAYLNLERSHSVISYQFELVFKDYGITPVQYNALRIINGSSPEGIPSLDIADRLISRVPDITRLIDRMMKEDWVKRKRDAHDRRVVRIRITPKGEKLLHSIAPALHQTQKSLFKSLSRDELKTFNALLEKARE